MSLRSILELDARLSSQMRVAEKPGLLRNFAIFFAHSGDSWFWAAALILFWFFSTSEWRQWETVEFFGLSGLAVVVLAVKFLFKRKRPEGPQLSAANGVQERPEGERREGRYEQLTVVAGAHLRGDDARQLIGNAREE